MGAKQARKGKSEKKSNPAKPAITEKMATNLIRGCFAALRAIPREKMRETADMLWLCAVPGWERLGGSDVTLVAYGLEENYDPRPAVFTPYLVKDVEDLPVIEDDEDEDDGDGGIEDAIEDDPAQAEVAEA